MKSLIVDDDFASRVILQGLLAPYGDCHVAINGKDAVRAHANALNKGQPYDLICLDIMMPELDGQGALAQIRAAEEHAGIISSHGAKVIMTTALGDARNVIDAFYELCDKYLVKPIDGEKLLQMLDELNLRPRDGVAPQAGTDRNPG